MARGALLIVSGWDAICALAAYDLAAAAQQADALPDEARVAPAGWWSPLTERQPAPPALSLARILDLPPNLSADAWSALLQSSDLRAIRTLRCVGAGLGPSAASVLAGAPGLEGLVSLQLDDNPLGMAGGLALQEARLLQRLHSLSLRRCGLSDSFVAVLVAHLGSAHLRHLALSGNGLTDQTVISLVTSPHVRELVTLDLSDNPITDEGARRLASSPDLRQLESLDLHGTALTPAGRRELYWSNYLPFALRQAFRD